MEIDRRENGDKYEAVVATKLFQDSWYTDIDEYRNEQYHAQKSGGGRIADQAAEPFRRGSDGCRFTEMAGNDSNQILRGMEEC